jgi:membrane-associated phospholipid phosphatase
VRESEGTAGDGSGMPLPRRAVLAPPLLGLAMFAAMAVTALALDLPINDPDGAILGSPAVLVSVVVIVFVSLDVIPLALLRTGWRARGLRTAIADIWRDRWSLKRLAIVVGALVGFYLTYVGYRNLKSFLPFARDASFDDALLDLDRNMTFGHDPGPVLHDLLGRGVAAQVLSLFYLTFLLFIPVSLGVAVVWQRRLHRGLWYVTAVNISWILGVASYYALPALGPVYAAPQLYATLEPTGVTSLQQTLLEHRGEVIASPHAADGVQSIAAFASLHVAIVVAAALMAQLLGLRRSIRVGLWLFFAGTILSTIYFGWHYIVDDIAGIVIGVVAVVLAAAVTGHELRPSPHARGVPLLPRRPARVTQ